MHYDFSGFDLNINATSVVEYQPQALDTSQEASDLLPAQLLLEFHFALEKSIFCSIHGSSQTPAPSKAATLFFKNNKQVCSC